MKGRLGCLGIAAISALLPLSIALVTIFSTGTGPRGYVRHHYERAAHLDIPGDAANEAFTSDEVPSEVSGDVSDTWKPIAQDLDGTGVYLRYSDDAVIIHPRDGGSVIHVMEVSDAYRHYNGIVGGFWGWTGTRGESFRGRGPGEGK